MTLTRRRREHLRNVMRVRRQSSTPLPSVIGPNLFQSVPFQISNNFNVSSSHLNISPIPSSVEQPILNPSPVESPRAPCPGVSHQRRRLRHDRRPIRYQQSNFPSSIESNASSCDDSATSLRQIPMDSPGLRRSRRRNIRLPLRYQRDLGDLPLPPSIRSRLRDTGAAPRNLANDSPLAVLRAGFGGVSSPIPESEMLERGSPPESMTDMAFARAELTSYFTIGLPDQECHHCGALFFDMERNTMKVYTRCCQQGKVSLPPIPQPSPLIESLLTSNHVQSRQFYSNLIYYNNALAMASIGARQFEFRNSGPPVIKLNGIFMHTTSSIGTSVGYESRRYAQLYILDPAQAVEARVTASNNHCDSDLMTELEEELRLHNVYARSFVSLKSIMDSELGSGRDISNLRMVLRENTSRDPRRFNAPHTNDVAVIFRTYDGAPSLPQDIMIHCNDGSCVRISETNPLCDPLSFPMLYSVHGHSWSPELTSGSYNVTLRKYYSFRLSFRSLKRSRLRDGTLDVPFLLGPLLQLYMVMAYLKIEKNQLDWLRFNQPKLMSEKYNVLRDFIRRNSDSSIRPGTQVILPSGFSGSPRNMHQNYLDSMALVQKFGKPCIFLTFTCNPKWEEITNSLADGETAFDRPDLSARVFKVKLSELLKDVIRKKLFGDVQAFTYTIEFQKRGLPHAHMLFILKQSSKVRNRDDVDTHVSAEIPDPVRYPTLHQCVLDFNIHGPCSTNFCIENGKCKRDFPKPLREETDIMNDTYPSYMRRNRFPVNRGTATTTTDEYIVPYSPYLTAKYRAHINVEICASIKSVKYIYKYIFKGFDAATVEIVDGDRVAHVDEIKAFLEARYVAAPEACWRIFEFPLHESSHSVIRLPVHLENEHIVVYPENEVPNDSQLDGRLRNSMLTAYFDLNRNSTEPLPYTYLEIPYHFRWDSATCSWLKRQRNHKLISRIYAVSPRDKELYSVRIMLLQRTGLKSFEQLRSGPDGVVHESFWDAAVSHGLLEDATEWTTCLRNAATVLMPKSLRLLFATICSHCNPPSCADLWSLFRDDISEDFLRENSVEIAYQLALRDIKEMIDSESSSHFSSLRLPYNPGLLASYSVSDRDHENDYAKSVSFVEEHLPSLNDDQRRIYETVMLSIMQEASVRDHLIFIDGPGGSGKTYLYNILIHSSIVRRKPLLAVSWTGIAATLMHGGETSHTTFKLPLHIFENTSIRAEPGTKLWNRIFNCQLLLWDEITLVPKHAFLAVDRLFRKIRNRENIPFGGVTVVCGGDWRQCLPIIRHAHRCAIIENTIKSCELWPRFKQFRLMTNMRVSDDSFSGFPSFATWLLALGNGTLGDTVVFPDAFFCSEQALIEFIFGDFIQYMNPADVATRSILCPTVNETMHINMKVLSMMPIPLQTFYSTDSLEDPTGTNATLFPLEFIHSLMPSGFPPHRLEIKPGSIVILLRNLNLKYRLTNGTRLIVRRLLPGLIEASVIQSSFVSELSVFLPRIEFISSEADIGVQFRRKQFPVRLGFAMTVNKSQGQTLSHVGLFMTEQLFSHGQLYVALSRARSSSNIRICNLSTPMNELRNIVYNEVITL